MSTENIEINYWLERQANAQRSDKLKELCETLRVLVMASSPEVGIALSDRQRICDAANRLFAELFPPASAQEREHG